MLSDRLLAAPDYDTIRDVKHLELLKRRFGDGALLHCEIMLKDVEESRRITRARSKATSATRRRRRST